MRTQRFVKSSEIPAPVSVVFEFHKRPDALERISPPWERVEMIERPAALQLGARTVIRVGIGPFKRLWVAEVVQYIENELFADIQRSGPFAYWYHRHRFEHGKRDTTIYTDEVDYALPFGFLGGILSPLMVAPRLERMFDYRHRRVASLIASQTS